MIETKIIDGKAFAEKLRADIKTRVAELKTDKGVTAGLAVILVGEDPASEVYVRNKGKQTIEAGMESFEFNLPAQTSEEELLKKIDELNNNPKIHGILVQLPLPKHINEEAVINAIAPEKDVDGFNIINVGKLATGGNGFVPCTPLGCSMLLKDAVGDLSGKHAVVIGRSNIVGKPMAALLLKESCTVTIAHSRTKDLPALLKTADIVVAAVGRPNMVKGEWLKVGAVVIDVGINRVTLADGKTKLVGDVDFASCQGIASAITPVPKGVGPMTIACLLENTYRACLKQNAKSPLPLGDV
ncbi:MAG: bifunctional methylenetetrahydrofolate dehydrogenase/methenyltetrahydrofolate cyclohydrolase FolD [Rickettsiales bacterium]|jgi:methylenetetrahydrofolate dehydrogenase (NADP+)/methenyltetrahydrofolate cyclohydrolase